jgi:hypothetical protein
VSRARPNGILERREGVLSPEEDVDRFAVPALCQRVRVHWRKARNRQFLALRPLGPGSKEEGSSYASAAPPQGRAGRVTEEAAPLFEAMAVPHTVV